MSKFKNLLFGNRLVRPLADYYHNLLDDYRLQERVTEIKADELDLSFPNEAITMIVVGQKASNQTYWLEGFGDQIQQIEEIVWLGGKDRRMDSPEGFSGRVEFVRLPKQAKGRDVNRLVQKAKVRSSSSWMRGSNRNQIGWSISYLP